MHLQACLCSDRLAVACCRYMQSPRALERVLVQINWRCNAGPCLIPLMRKIALLYVLHARWEHP